MERATKSSPARAVATEHESHLLRLADRFYIRRFPAAKAGVEDKRPSVDDRAVGDDTHDKND